MRSTSINPPILPGAHIFRDYDYKNSATNSETVIYGNGAILTLDGKKVNTKEVIFYTDIVPSYKYTTNDRGIVKTSFGKVIVGITTSDTKPEISKQNKIVDTSASDIARARIQNGRITVTSVGKKGGLVYLWVIDTGKKGASAYCPIDVKLAPKRLEIQDMSNKALTNIKLGNGNSLDVHVAGIVSNSVNTEDCTYTAIVDTRYKDYIQVSPMGDSGKEFTIKAIDLKNNKDTKTMITFKCDQNGKKLNCSVTVAK